MEHDTYCHECKREYSGVSNLRRHIKKFHPDIPPPYQEKKDYPFTCEECGKNFSYMRNFKSHRKSHLPPDQVVEFNKAKIKKKCPICDYSDWDRRGLFHHFREEHEIIILPEHKDFPDFDSFLDWKKVYETENKSLFIKRHEASTAKYESTMIYRCHRSGYYQPRGKNIRRLKTQGSCKIDGYCPATIKAMKHKSGSVKVMLFSTHVGHNEDLPPLTVSKQEKREIKTNGKLKGIRLRHKTSLSLQKDLIVKTNQGWLYPSCKSGEVYCITENEEECQCEIICSECNVCIHRYSCTCSDSSKKGNMCKHVHLLCQPLKGEDEILQEDQLQQSQLEEQLKTDQLNEHYHEQLQEQLAHEQLQTEQLQHEQLQHEQLHEQLQHEQLQHQEQLQHEHLHHDQLQHEQLQTQHHSGHSDDELIIYEGLHPEDDTDMQELADHHQHIQNMLEDRKQSILNKLNDVLQRCNNENLLREIEMYVIQLDARVECGVLTVPPLVPLPNTPVAVAVATPLLEITSPKRQKTVLTELKQSKPIVRFQANDLFRHL